MKNKKNLILIQMERITEWEKHWRSTVTEAFEKNLFYLKQKELIQESDWKFLYPFLRVLPKEEYVNVILREIRQLAQFSDAYSSSMPSLYVTMGNLIYKKYEVRGNGQNSLHLSRCLISLLSLFYQYSFC